MLQLKDRPRLARAVANTRRRLQLGHAVLQSFDFARQLGPGTLACEEHEVSTLLYARLADEDVEEVERLIAQDPEFGATAAQAGQSNLRHAVLLSYGMWLGVTAVAAKTGLPVAQPPPDIHTMARGPLAAAGGLYEADLVVDALTSAGGTIEDVHTALDFGCSSGRVVRVLAAAYPDIAWHGCDPNEPAIAWARQNLPGIEFFRSAASPPLVLAEGAFDLVYAISIWSHFEPELGLRWFNEMHRLLKPGGHLVATTHGLQSLAFSTAAGWRSADQAYEILRALYATGSWYAAEFGERGDWGVVNPSWGSAFLTPEWLLTKLCPKWRVVEFGPGRNQSNQDVYVLERV
jgi:SAM-dependent methyltransferase